MLTSISPLGERSRGMKWPVTVAFFITGAVGGGLLIGLVVGGLGRVLGAVNSSFAATGVSAGILMLVFTAVEWTRWRHWVAGVHRQVNEDWLPSYRGWVYGVGFGFQLGLGFVTIANAALFCLLATTLLFHSLALSILAFGTYGAVRGLSVLLAAGATEPAGLLAIDRRMELLGPMVQRGGRIAQVAVGFAAIGIGLGI